MKPLTKKAKEEMILLGEQNNKLRFWKMGGIEFELIGTKKNKNGSFTLSIRNNTTKEIKEIGSKKWESILIEYKATR